MRRCARLRPLTSNRSTANSPNETQTLMKTIIALCLLAAVLRTSAARKKSLMKRRNLRSSYPILSRR